MDIIRECDGITEIDLPQTIFDINTFIPMRVNLIIGRNGTGKSTLSNLIRNADSLSFHYGRTADSYQIEVFDQQYITNNVMMHDKLPGIVTFSKHNAEIESTIKGLKEKLNQYYILLSNQQAEKDQLENEKSKILNEFQEICWKQTKDLRKRFESALSGKKTKQKLSVAILAAEPHNCDIAALSSTYDTSFGSETQLHPLLQTVDNVKTLDQLVDTELLISPIISSSDSLFFRFIKNIHAIDWVQQGHKQFNHQTNGICPYCQQSLPADFDEQIASCINEEYTAALQRVQDLMESYRLNANELFIPLQAHLKSMIPNIDYRLYASHLKILKQRIKGNLEQIQNKIQSPSKSVTLEQTSELLSSIQTDISAINSIITERNRLITDQKSSQMLCSKSVVEYFAYLLSNQVTAFKMRRTQFESHIRNIADKIEQNKMKIQSCSAQIKSLTQQIVDVSSTVCSINQMLSEAGFRSFYLKNSNISDSTYAVLRQDGNQAINLSEGERNFLAFLYFYNTVLKDASTTRPVITVLDDPFTGLDQKTSEIVLQLTNELIQDCATTDRLSQLFVMTYNESYFYIMLKNHVCQNPDVLACRFQRENALTTIEIMPDR